MFPAAAVEPTAAELNAAESVAKAVATEGAKPSIYALPLNDLTLGLKTPDDDGGATQKLVDGHNASVAALAGKYQSSQEPLQCDLLEIGADELSAHGWDRLAARLSCIQDAVRLATDGREVLDAHRAAWSATSKDLRESEAAYRREASDSFKLAGFDEKAEAPERFKARVNGHPLLRDYRESVSDAMTQGGKYGPRLIRLRETHNTLVKELHRVVDQISRR